ncbi:MAG: hypothetical protein V2J55_05555 [Candidatus Competibacteraceae bacterium]|nr:hypothetical protein [Candidatus Competibacteraceae bacterium]
MIKHRYLWFMLGCVWLAIVPSSVQAYTCDMCVVRAVNAHRMAMVQEFAKLREHISSEIKTVRQSIAQVEKDSLRAQADVGYQLPAGGCETATAGAGAGPARDRAEAYLRAFNHIRREERTGTAASEAMFDAHIEHYCNEEDIGSRGCEQAGERPDAQFQTETLLSGSGLGDDADPAKPNTFLPEVLSFDDDRITDARRYIDNAVNPFPIDDVDEALRETAQGRAFWLHRKLYEGRLSASRYSYNHALALRVPAAALKGWLLAVWEESKADEHLDDLIATLPDNISYMELLKTEVDRRYASPNWYAGIAGNHAAANLRELAYMQALALNLSYLRLRQGERIELLLARQNVGDAHELERTLTQEARAATTNLVNSDTGSAAPTPTGGQP